MTQPTIATTVPPDQAAQGRAPARWLALSVAVSLALSPRAPHAQELPSGERLRLQLSKRLEHRTPIKISAGSAELMATGESLLRGDVQVSYGDRTLSSQELRYDPQTQQLSAVGDVQYSDPQIEVSGNLASFDPAAGDGDFSSASFTVKGEAGRGEAAHIHRQNENVTVLEDVAYTTCPVDNTDWQLEAPNIQLNRETEVGSARNVRVRFKGVPVLYAPYLTFPLSDKRKSGFLTPDLGTSERSGVDIALPYYVNISPNLDNTITPRLLSERGFQIKNEFRYLSERSRGQLDLELMSEDEKTGEERRFAGLRHHTAVTPNLHLEADVRGASDGRYLEDLSTSLSSARITHLERRVDLSWHTGAWDLIGRFQGFQTLDDSIARDDRPYQRVPQLLALGRWPDQWRGLNLQLDAEVVNFERSDGTTGIRTDVSPQISLPMSGRGLHFTPSVSLTHTRYQLDDITAGTEDSLTRTLPIVTLDSRAVFERALRRSKRVLHTLEPRIQYSYIPFRDQANIPVFDTGDPDLNFVQLFRPNRFVGADRIGDTNQLAFGVTSRLINTENNKELLNATLGQVYYLEDRDVTLPGQTQQSDEFSDFLAEIRLRLSDRWNADIDYQFGSSDTQKAAVRLQFRPGPQSVVNLGYRFRRGELEQTDVSFALPIAQRWDLVGRWNFSLAETQTLERFLGLRYSSCCWALRLVSRSYVSTREGESEQAIYVQLELKGLTGVGTPVRGLLDRGILGYGLTDRTDPGQL